LSDWVTEFAAVRCVEEEGVAFQARHGLDAVAYQHAFDDLVSRGFRPLRVSGYGDGFNPA